MAIALVGRTDRLTRRDIPLRVSRVRSVMGNVLFLALLLGCAGATFLWGPKFSVVLSHSMDPTYTTGDALLVVPWGHPGVGDIAQFKVAIAPGHPETVIPVAHRIIGQDSRGFITKGDNPQATPDFWRVTPDMIEGKVVWWLPQTWMFRIASALIGIAVLLLLLPARQVAASIAGKHERRAASHTREICDIREDRSSCTTRGDVS
jgi:signal peptidase I